MTKMIHVLVAAAFATDKAQFHMIFHPIVGRRILTFSAVAVRPELSKL